MVKQIGIYVAIAAAWGLAFAAKGAFEIPDVWFWLGIVAVSGILTSYNFESRLQTLEARVVHKDYSGVIKALEGERHVPQHQQPESLAAGGGVTSFINASHEILFDDFRWFGAAMNFSLNAPWSIEELNDTDVRGYEGPEVGRRYNVWYNAWQVGTIEVTVGGYSALRPEEFAENRKARVDLELSDLRFIPYQDARSLLYQLALFICPFDDTEDGDVSRAKASALGGYLWEAVRSPEYDPSFEYTVEGPYTLLRDQVDHWKSHGVDPMVKWNGDRPKEWS